MLEQYENSNFLVRDALNESIGRDHRIKSNRDLAQHTGISKGTIDTWRNGISAPSNWHHMRLLIEALGPVFTNHLLLGTGQFVHDVDDVAEEMTVNQLTVHLARTTTAAAEYNDPKQHHKARRALPRVFFGLMGRLATFIHQQRLRRAAA